MNWVCHYNGSIDCCTGIGLKSHHWKSRRCGRHDVPWGIMWLHCLLPKRRAELKASPCGQHLWLIKKALLLWVSAWLHLKAAEWLLAAIEAVRHGRLLLGVGHTPRSTLSALTCTRRARNFMRLHKNRQAVVGFSLCVQQSSTRNISATGMLG